MLKKNHFYRLLGGSLAILMTFGASVSANAINANTLANVPIIEKPAAIEQVVADLLKMDEQIASWKVLETTELALLLDIYEASSQETSSGFILDMFSVSGWKIDENLSVLKIPFMPGQGILSLSSLQVFFNVKNEILSVVEFNFIGKSADSGIMRMWLDNNLEFDRNIVAPTSKSELLYPQDNGTVHPEYSKGDWWGNFNECLSTAGVPSWVVTGLSIACSVICVATVGLGCFACLAAAAGAFSGTIAGCIAVANKFS